jgi:hypothetical protein
MNETNWTAHWLRRARITDDPVGEVIANMRRDPDVPPLFQHINEVRSYLRRKGASTEALAAVPILWRRYLNWFRQTRRADTLKARQKAVAAEGSAGSP